MYHTHRVYREPTWKNLKEFFESQEVPINLIDKKILENLMSSLTDSALSQKVEFPRVNIIHSKVEGAYIIEAAVPGYNKENLTIKFDGNETLQISGDNSNVKDVESIEYLQREIKKSKFTRSLNYKFFQNVDVHQMSATFDLGILRIKLPLKEPKKQQSGFYVNIL